MERVSKVWAALDVVQRRQRRRRTFFSDWNWFLASLRREPWRRGGAIVAVVLPIVLVWLAWGIRGGSATAAPKPGAVASWLPSLVLALVMALWMLSWHWVWGTWMQPARLCRVLDARRARRAAWCARGGSEGAAWVERQRAAWLREAPRLGMGVRAQAWNAADPWQSLLHIGVVCGLLGMDMLWSSIGRGNFGAWVSVGVGAVLLVGWPVVIYLAWRPAGVLRRRVLAALRDGMCPECGYALGGGVEGLGPEVCSECGLRWPLVPPERAG